MAVYRVGLQALLDSEPRLTPIPQSSLPVLQLPLGNDLIHPPDKGGDRIRDEDMA